MIKKITLYFIFLIGIFSTNYGRSPLHCVDDLVPTIFTEWYHTSQQEKEIYHYFRTKKYQFTNATMTEYPLFKTFDAQDVQDNYVPEAPFTFRNNPEKSISYKKFKKLLDHFFQEILNKRTIYQDFEILKNDDFNIKKQAVLLIVKAKKYPIVVKLFMETPRSFMRPHNKGMIPVFQFGVGGGATRHLLGFTRIKNSKTIAQLLKGSQWEDIIDIPKKWYWIPTYPWIKITSENLGADLTQKTIILPGAYMVIADYVDPEKIFKISSSKDRKTALGIANFLQCRIDPHINNFIEEKKTGKIVLIDTEHFPTLVGLQKAPTFKSYTQMYTKLAFKFLTEHLLSFKNKRIHRQRSGYYPFCNP